MNACGSIDVGVLVRVRVYMFARLEAVFFAGRVLFSCATKNKPARHYGHSPLRVPERLREFDQMLFVNASLK